MAGILDTLQAQGTVRSLVMALEGGKLLLPSAVVAEVISYREGQKPSNKQPAWLFSFIDWRGQRVPVISLSQIFGVTDTLADFKKDCRIVILYALEIIQIIPFYAFISTDVSRTINIMANNLLNPREEKPPAIALSIELSIEGAVEGERIWLPDLAFIENLLKKSITEAN